MVDPVDTLLSLDCRILSYICISPPSPQLVAAPSPLPNLPLILHSKIIDHEYIFSVYKNDIGRLDRQTRVYEREEPGRASPEGSVCTSWRSRERDLCIQLPRKVCLLFISLRGKRSPLATSFPCSIAQDSQICGATTRRVSPHCERARYLDLSEIEHSPTIPIGQTPSSPVELQPGKSDALLCLN